MSAFSEIEEAYLEQDYSIYRAPSSDTSQGSRSSNRERSGYRDLTVSKIARSIGCGPESKTDSVRHIDGDLMQICKQCSKVVVFVEDSADSGKQMTFTSMNAYSVSHTAWAVKVIHVANNEFADLPEVKIVENGTEVVFESTDVPVALFKALMENLSRWHELHECTHSTPWNIVRR